MKIGSIFVSYVLSSKKAIVNAIIKVYRLRKLHTFNAIQPEQLNIQLELLVL